MKKFTEIDRFLDTYELQKLTQEDTNMLSNAIKSNEIDSAIKNLLTKTPQDIMTSHLKSTNL